MDLLQGSKTKAELKNYYKISLPTLLKWLNSVPDLKDVKKKNIFTPKEVQLIQNHLG